MFSFHRFPSAILWLQLLAVQGHRSRCQSKAHVMSNFLLVINSNFGHISYRFREIDARG